MLRAAPPGSVCECLREAPANEPKPSAVTGAVNKQVLCRLALDPRDAVALMALYEEHEVEIRAATSRWFGSNRSLREGAINNILAAIARQAVSYDPETTDAEEWIRERADAEARRLREALDKAGGKSLRTGRAM